MTFTKRWLLRLIVVMLAIAPGACHFQWTAPILWAHQSSSAFDWFAGFWVLSIVWFGFIVAIGWQATSKGEL